MSAATRSLPDHQRMKAIDIYNLSDAFEALDEENRTGRLDYAQIQTLYLGLGYNDCGRRRMTVQDLQADAQALGLPATDLSLPEVLQLFESYTRERKRAWQHTFDVLKAPGKNRLTAQNLVDAAASVQEPLTLELARAMIALSTENVALTEEDFLQLWEPPDP